MGRTGICNQRGGELDLTNKEFVLDMMTMLGKASAEVLQVQAESITSTELIAKENYLPLYDDAKAIINMLQRTVGFTVRTNQGNVCRLLQNYDSDVYTGEPEEYPALWGFKYSTDPSKAKPFLALSTSPYNVDECCIWNDAVYRSTHDNNTWSPDGYPAWWEVVV